MTLEFEYGVSTGLVNPPLANHEADRLSAILLRVGREGGLTLEYLDGFCAALICGPVATAPDRYVGDIINEHSAGFDVELMGEAKLLLVRHWRSLDHMMRRGDLVGPLVSEGTNCADAGRQWARGFLRGVRTHHSEWAAMLYDQNQSAALLPIMALAEESTTGAPFHHEALSRLPRSALLTDASYALMHIYRFFTQGRHPEPPIPANTLH